MNKLIENNALINYYQAKDIKITGHQLKIFQFIVENIQKNDGQETTPINYEKLAVVLHRTNLQIKSSIQELLKKDLIKIAYRKDGRAGFCKYSIDTEIYKEYIERKNINDSLLNQFKLLKENNKENFYNPTERTREQGYIYLFEIEDSNKTKFLKIGWEVSEEIKRDKSLQTGCPFEIKPLHKIKGSIKAEKYLHRKFKHLHFRGEWFSYNKEILNLFTNPLAIELIENLTK